MKKIVCIGSTMCDIFIEYQNADKTQCIQDEAHHISIEEGKKIEIDTLNYQLGGGAANSATAFALFGMDASVISVIGADTNGFFCQASLELHNVHTNLLIKKENESTGTGFVLPCSSGNRPILVHRAANLTLNTDDIQLDQIKKYDALYITSLSQDTSRLLPIITREAKKHNLFVATNPGTSQLTAHVDTLKDSLQNIDALITNAFEAELLFNEIAPHQSFDIKTYLKKAHAMGPKIVAVTCGKDGVHVFDGDQFYFEKSMKTNVVCTVGAGDAFSATFVACLLNNDSVESALKAGIAQSASVIGKVGATQGLQALDMLK